jgi:cell division protein FtsB
MRVLSIVFAALILLLQYPLWLGKGGWLHVWETDRQVKAQKDINAKLHARNDALDAEVRDLKQGYDAIEERARYELGMIKQDEIFVHILEKSPPAAPAAAAPAPKGETAGAKN